jgi:hypothetical protein
MMRVRVGVDRGEVEQPERDRRTARGGGRRARRSRRRCRGARGRVRCGPRARARGRPRAGPGASRRDVASRRATPTPASAARRPVSTSTSSVWPFPSMPAIPTISPARTSRSTPSRIGLCLTGWRSRRPRASSRTSRARGALVDAQQHLAADHHRGQAAGVGVGPRDGADHASVAHHAHAVADLHHLVELVRDEHDRVPLRGVAAQELEQAAGLLRRQDGGGLVHDQDAGVAEQGLEDLDLLLQADRQLVDAASGSRSKPKRSISSRALRRAARCRAPVPRRGSAPSTRFSATVSVSTSMKCWWTMPMPCVDRVARRAHHDRRPVDLDRARVGLLQAVEDLHQRALAGAVLADQRVDLAPGDLEVDVVVGEHQREALDDVACGPRTACGMLARTWTRFGPRVCYDGGRFGG